MFWAIKLVVTSLNLEPAWHWHWTLSTACIFFSTLDVADLQCAFNPAAKVQPGLVAAQETNQSAVELQAVHIRAQIQDLAAQVSLCIIINPSYMTSFLKHKKAASTEVTGSIPFRGRKFHEQQVHVCSDVTDVDMFGLWYWLPECCVSLNHFDVTLLISQEILYFWRLELKA